MSAYRILMMIVDTYLVWTFLAGWQRTAGGYELSLRLSWTLLALANAAVFWMTMAGAIR